MVSRYSQVCVSFRSLQFTNLSAIVGASNAGVCDQIIELASSDLGGTIDCAL